MNIVIAAATRIVALFVSLVPIVAIAEGTVLTGTFDGSERTMPRSPNPFDCDDKAAGFLAVSFEVSRPGSYHLFDPYDFHFNWSDRTGGYTLRLYPGGFEPSVSPNPVPLTDGRYALQSGRPYSLVVHARCPGYEGAWAAAFQGPGSVLSDAAVELPPFSRGSFTPASPTMTSDCGSGYYAWGWGPIHNAPYAQVGPIRLKRGGEYYYGAQYASQACLSIYTAPVDPANRQANRIALLAGFDTRVTLEADTDYWFVSHLNGWGNIPPYDEYLHVLVPPAAFRINAGLNGAWYDPATPGEGYFISVFESLNQLFLANFTYSGHAVPGDRYGHRWYTAVGEISGDAAELDLELTAGGAFNDALPAPQQVQVGRLRAQFSDCAHGSITVDAGAPDSSPSAQLEFPLRRLGSDWENLCRSQYEGPGEVGPL